jgi:hypothetical protein
VWAKARHLGLLKEMKNKTYGAVVWRVVSMCMALPLLPPDEIEPALRAIINYATARGVYAVLTDFFKYMYRQWIQKVGVNVISVFNQPHRTNNSVESFNRVFNARTKVKSPNAYVFIGEF